MEKKGLRRDAARIAAGGQFADWHSPRLLARVSALFSRLNRFDNDTLDLGTICKLTKKNNF